MKWIVLFLLFFSPWAGANNEGPTEPLRLPVRLSLTLPDSELRFHRVSDTGQVINTFQSFPVQMAEWTRLDNERFRVTLLSPIVVELTEREGAVYQGTRILRSFVVQHPSVEVIDTFWNLRAGDVISLDPDSESQMREIVQRFQQGERHNLTMDLDADRLLAPRLQRVEALEFSINLNESARPQGSLVEHLHLRVRDFANIHSLGLAAREAPKSQSIENIERIYTRQSPLLQQYLAVADSVINHRLQIGWYEPFIQTDPTRIHELVMETTNAQHLFPPTQCQRIFGQ